MSAPLVRRWCKVIAASELRPNARLVALTLSLHMNGKGGSCFPSLPTLAEETGLSRRTVWSLLAELEEAGFIACERRPGRVTLYRARGVEPVQQVARVGEGLPVQQVARTRAARDAEPVQLVAPEDAKRTKPRTKVSARARAREDTYLGSKEEEADRAYTKA